MPTTSKTLKSRTTIELEHDPELEGLELGIAPGLTAPGGRRRRTGRRDRCRADGARGCTHSAGPDGVWGEDGHQWGETWPRLGRKDGRSWGETDGR